MTRNRIALIPARGGSKRLPRKNVLPFFGRPMLAHTVAAALASGRFDAVVVSTEDQAIAEAAEAAGATVDRRPAGLATDDAGVVDVCLEFLRRVADDGVLCCLYPAAPMRNAADVQAVVDLIKPGHCEFAMAVTRYDLPPHQALTRDADGCLAPLFPELVERRDEEIGPLVVDNGSTYAVDIAAFLRHRTFFGPGLRGHEMPRERSVDINEPADLALATLHYQRRLSCAS